MADVTELVTVFSFRGSTAPLAEFNERLGGSVRSIAGITASLAGLVAGITASVGAIASADTRAQQLANSVGLSVDLAEQLGAAGATAGFEFENIIDLAEEMNNKLGESAGIEEMTAVTESLKILGLGYEEIRSLAPEEQFKAITDAALQMEDAQKAAAAADILMGGEANKLIGVLRQQGGSIDQITAQYRDLTFRTEESRKGAVAFTETMNNLSFGGMSALQEFGGILAAELNPMLRRLSDWMTVNRGLIQDGITRIAEGIGVFTESVVRLMPILIALTAVFVGLKLATGGYAAALALAMSPTTLIIAGVAALLLVVDDLIVAFQGGNSVIADFFQSFFGVDIRPVLQGIVDAVGVMFEGIKAYFAALSEFAGGVFKGITAALNGDFDGAIDHISGAFFGLFSFLTDSWMAIAGFFGDALNSVFGGVIESVQQTFTGVIDWIMGKLEFVIGKLRSVGEFFGLVDEVPDQQRLSPGGGGGSQVNNSVSQDINISVTSDDPATAANLVRDRLNEQLADAQTQFSRGGI